MGWRKYYEDNISICIGRMVVRDSIPACQCKEEKNKMEQVIIKQLERAANTEAQNGRRGLELSFQNGVEEKLIRKLQINGWWWSKSNACWCNLDTQGNREFARKYSEIKGMKLVAV